MEPSTSSSPTSQTKSPSMPPTRTPSKHPSSSPSRSPSKSPTSSPSGYPSKRPSFSPSGSPSKGPSSSPTGSPSKSPSISPTRSSSRNPTRMPSISPSNALPITPTPISLAPATSTPTMGQPVTKRPISKSGKVFKSKSDKGGKSGKYNKSLGQFYGFLRGEKSGKIIDAPQGSTRTKMIRYGIPGNVAVAPKGVNNAPMPVAFSGQNPSNNDNSIPKNDAVHNSSGEPI
eukprot:CCRYP_017311-RD/>CCRYP_017311-RD protein AED:0.04 eAED:0.04 QI:1519/1/1/1/0.6/0.45/11/2240/229